MGKLSNKVSQLESNIRDLENLVGQRGGYDTGWIYLGDLPKASGIIKKIEDLESYLQIRYKTEDSTLPKYVKVPTKNKKKAVKKDAK